jgi:hypothetical protein
MLKLIEFAFAGDVFQAARPWVWVGVISPSTPARAEDAVDTSREQGKELKRRPLPRTPIPALPFISRNSFLWLRQANAALDCVTG